MLDVNDALFYGMKVNGDYWGCQAAKIKAPQKCHNRGPYNSCYILSRHKSYDSSTRFQEKMLLCDYNFVCIRDLWCDLYENR